MATRTSSTASVARTALTLTGASALAFGALSVGAQAAEQTTSSYRVTATPSDSTPASGQTFRVTGRLTNNGKGVGQTPVKIQTLRNGVWQNLSGAQVQTGPRGWYTVRVILISKGERTLRAIASTPGTDPRARFVVRVH